MSSIGIKLTERKILEARGGIEPPIMALQTIALPLGYRAPELEIGGEDRREIFAPSPCSVLHLQTLLALLRNSPD